MRIEEREIKRGGERKRERARERFITLQFSVIYTEASFLHTDLVCEIRDKSQKAFLYEKRKNYYINIIKMNRKNKQRLVSEFRDLLSVPEDLRCERRSVVRISSEVDLLVPNLAPSAASSSISPQTNVKHTADRSMKSPEK